MEEAGIDWSCKTCKEQVAKAETPPTSQEELMDTETAPPSADLTDEGVDQETSPTAAATGRRARAAARRQQSGGDSQEKPKAKAARCHMCSKPPRLSSIYCSGKYSQIGDLQFFWFCYVS
jgi:hypothetical protein